MVKPKIFITRKLPEEVLSSLKSNMDIKMWPEEEKPIPHELLLEEAREADALLTMLSDKVDRNVFDQAKNLKIVANLAVGYDNIDLDTAKERGIIVCNTPDVLTETTADLTFALLMATARRLIEASDYLKSGHWQNWSPLGLAGTDIHHKSIGIVGMGRIGQALAKRTLGFHMPLYYHNRSRNLEAEKELGAKYLPFDELIRTCDFIVCLTPLTPETRQLFDKKAFEMMKPTAIFINVSRGAVVDESALIEALQSKQIAGAGLDVFQIEPIDPKHPLLAFPQVVALPHIGSASVETRVTMMKLCLDNIKKVLIDHESPVTPVI